MRIIVTVVSVNTEIMNKALDQARNRFVQAWGEMGYQWGINKVMAQIHALLMVSDEPLSTDDVMGELQISRGHANTNLRGLVDWGLVRRVFQKGERKEYFVSEKDVWKMFCTVSRERRKREIAPAIHALEESLTIAGAGKDSAGFREQLTSLLEFLRTADLLLSKVAQQEKNKILPLLVKFLG